MEKINLNLITKSEAEEISKAVLGVPSDNRVLIFYPANSEKRTNSGIILSQSTEEGVPRKGVVIKTGYLSDEFKHYKNLLEVGNIITFGIYAGKEVCPTMSKDMVIPKDSEFSVLSVSEIIFVEPGKESL